MTLKVYLQALKKFSFLDLCPPGTRVKTERKKIIVRVSNLDVHPANRI